LSAGEVRRTCLVTGAAGTLGAALCRRFGPDYDVAGVYHNQVPPLASQESVFFDPFDPGRPLSENDHPIFGIQADLATAEGCAWAVSAALERLGCLDLVVNAAAYPVWGSLLEDERIVDTAERQLAVNVLAPLRVAVETVRQDWSQHDGTENRAANRCVVNLSSTAGVRLYPSNGQSVYAASKAALNHLTCHLAEELSPLGVRVVALAPDSFPAAVSLDDVVEAVVQLEQSEVTGQVLVMDATSRRWLALSSEVSAMSS
jgi:NAD(P)-dependent dehydrogenase (short-subunit alcohol dehydrogenase family)